MEGKERSDSFQDHGLCSESPHLLPSSLCSVARCVVRRCAGVGVQCICIVYRNVNCVRNRSLTILIFLTEHAASLPFESFP